MRRIEPDLVTDVVLLRLRPGAGRAALLKQIVDAPPGNVYLPVKPSDLSDLERVGGLPSAIAGLLALMAMATMAHSLTLSVRRRRRDLAILKVLGFVRSQVARTLAWQSSTVAVLAVVVGVPAGLAAGRLAWSVFADRLGVSPQPATPLLATALLVPATLLLANLVAVVPATLAARTQPTSIPRDE
jgi:predicted lysophospholipase L1 biosynthesis ABC-type transport system permease subunit